jgi:hypothetical protein
MFDKPNWMRGYGAPSILRPAPMILDDLGPDFSEFEAAMMAETFKRKPPLPSISAGTAAANLSTQQMMEDIAALAKLPPGGVFSATPGPEHDVLSHDGGPSAPLYGPPRGAVIGHAGYKEAMFKQDRYRQTLKRLAATLPDLMKEEGCDFIAVRGSSGIAFGFALQFLIDVKVVMVRKEDERSHGCKVEGPYGRLHRYLILDDLVCSGETVRAIVTAIDNEARGGGVSCAGVVCWQYAAQRPQGRLAKEDHTSIGAGRIVPVWEFQ